MRRDPRHSETKIPGVRSESLVVEQQMEAIAKIDSGELPSFFVDRAPAKKGMACASFSEKAKKELVKLVKRSLAGSDLEPARVEDATVGGCQGLRVRMNVRAKDGTQWLADVRAASDGKTMYLFSLRNHSANFEKNLETYEKAMATLRLAGAP